MDEILYLPHSKGCFVCGSDNPHGLQVTFYVSDNNVCVDLKLLDFFNSYVGVAHGGVLSSVLDEAMGWAAFIFSDSEKFFFTRELTVTYKKIAPLNQCLKVVTEFIGTERGNLALAKGKVIDINNTVYTSSKGLFFPISNEKMEETKNYLCFDDNLKYHPKALKYCR